MVYRHFHRRGAAYLLWYIVYVIIAGVVLSILLITGSSFFTAHADRGNVQADIVFERTLRAVHARDHLTGRHLDQLASPDVIRQAFTSSSRELAIEVIAGNRTIYVNEDRYNIMRERAPVHFVYRTKTTVIGSTNVSTTLVIQP